MWGVVYCLAKKEELRVVAFDISILISLNVRSEDM